eukprot:TRINITY_DN9441_c0_g1_i1.p1 TRINITY_DN9441_c0_g1~~TRINITY_DN9441_c0_g1_i1.p1  ORF type:complete len:231 (+),score=56.48 TRINITY_DN9441_c0_g1_i1:111-803(+)
MARQEDDENSYLTGELYEPCMHPGPCGAQCVCARSGHFCDVSCRCAASCDNRFPGCFCEQGECAQGECVCFCFSRECDPRVCRCSACNNANIQTADARSEEDTVEVGRSAIAGDGAFAARRLEAGEFVIEYKGELISQEVAEERGREYDRSGSSYLFNLSRRYALDATQSGNNARYLNHQQGDAANCVAHLLYVRGRTRIGIFARKRIRKGTELTIDYGYDPAIVHRSAS